MTIIARRRMWSPSPTARRMMRPTSDNQPKNEAPGYTGHYEDSLTELTYMQQRYYDADLSRFLSVDPIAGGPGNVFNFNRYAYASNNPLKFVDPTGMLQQVPHMLD
ncbi:MAG TPA: RHS repeat-associated core domain-containing protein, partial [Candidatus Saccharimonadales bacterium]|nr:RHS repeat-associated core domain-containing protein [Candidatus Saccharimonadales bacterium]